MKTSRVCAAVALTLGFFAADDARADGSTVVLNTFTRVMVPCDNKGPAKVGKNTGAGCMDSAFGFRKEGNEVQLITIYTRSDSQPNGNGSYMQGGIAFAKLTERGVIPGAELNLPRLNGERAFMRPIVCPLPGGRVLAIAASEDNGVNNNPQPVAYVVSTDGKRLDIPNSNRGNQDKPTNLIQLATNKGINVLDPTNQRGPHTIVQINDTTCVVGMQYNNQASEAFSVSVRPDNTIDMNWLERYSNTAQHCRPSVAYDGKDGYHASVEADNQPAEIGWRLTRFNVATGKPVNSKIVVRSKPDQNQYVSEPAVDILNDNQVAVSYGLSQKVRDAANGNGHAGGKAIHALAVVDKNSLAVVGQPQIGVGQYGRHGGSFALGYGPTGSPAIAIISGSSTGTGGGFLQVFPQKPDGTLALKNEATAYAVSPYSDVANLQARGKHNPNNQARGFINGMGRIPNPGYTTDPTAALTRFMPEVKEFAFSAVTGYSSPEALQVGLKESIWVSLVPAAWQEGLVTVPGKATDKPGTNADGTGPLPRTNGGPGENGSVIGGDETGPGRGRAFDATNDGCSVGQTRQTGSESSYALIGLGVAAALVIARRKRGEV
jgi:hypothetical protein